MYLYLYISTPESYVYKSYICQAHTHIHTSYPRRRLLIHQTVDTVRTARETRTGGLMYQLGLVAGPCDPRVMFKECRTDSRVRKSMAAVHVRRLAQDTTVNAGNSRAGCCREHVARWSTMFSFRFQSRCGLQWPCIRSPSSRSACLSWINL